MRNLSHNLLIYRIWIFDELIGKGSFFSVFLQKKTNKEAYEIYIIGSGSHRGEALHHGH